jgi:RNA polymerase sigma-70 factor (ECF subfamily)
VTKPLNRTAKEILDLIRQLPDAYRETLVFRFVEGMTGPEIAARTGLTPASVRVNLHRGMKMLREKMGVAVTCGRQ